MHELSVSFSSNSLKMHEMKIDFIILCPKQKAANSLPCGTNGTVSYRFGVKIFGAILDPILSLDAHISSFVQKCNSIFASLYKFGTVSHELL